MTIDLAAEFHKLASDLTWPWELTQSVDESDGKYRLWVWSPSQQRSLEKLRQDNSVFGKFIVESPLVRAKLALKVLDAMECPGYDIDYILSNENITPSDYENVCKRVEKAG